MKLSNIEAMPNFYERSKCCGAPVFIGGDDDEGIGSTHYFICTKCDKACDIGGEQDRGNPLEGFY
jgi:hypothetical protein